MKFAFESPVGRRRRPVMLMLLEVLPVGFSPIRTLVVECLRQEHEELLGNKIHRWRANLRVNQLALRNMFGLLVDATIRHHPRRLQDEDSTRRIVDFVSGARVIRQTRNADACVTLPSLIGLLEGAVARCLRWRLGLTALGAALSLLVIVNCWVRPGSVQASSRDFLRTDLLDPWFECSSDELVLASPSNTKGVLDKEQYIVMVESSEEVRLRKKVREAVQDVMDSYLQLLHPVASVHSSGAGTSSEARSRGADIRIASSGMDELKALLAATNCGCPTRGDGDSWLEHQAGKLWRDVERGSSRLDSLLRDRFEPYRVNSQMIRTRAVLDRSSTAVDSLVQNYVIDTDGDGFDTCRYEHDADLDCRCLMLSRDSESSSWESAASFVVNRDWDLGVSLHGSHRDAWNWLNAYCDPDSCKCTLTWSSCHDDAPSGGSLLEVGYVLDVGGDLASGGSSGREP